MHESEVFGIVVVDPVQQILYVMLPYWRCSQSAKVKSLCNRSVHRNLNFSCCVVLLSG